MSLLLSPRPLLIVDALPETAYGLVFRELSTSRLRTLHIVLKPEQNSTWIANRLVDQCAQANIEGIGRGMPYSYVLDRVSRVGTRADPVILLVERAECSIQFCNSLARMCQNHAGAIRAVLAGYGRPEWTTFTQTMPATTVISDRELLVTPDEAKQWIADNHYGATISSMPSKAVTFPDLVRTTSDTSLDLSTSDSTSVHLQATVEPSPTLPQTVTRLESGVAFNPTCDSDSNLSSRTSMDDLGDALLARGEAHALSHYAEEQLEQHPDDGSAMYWWFQAQVALGRHREAGVSVRRYLALYEIEAPELLAAYSSSLRPSGALEFATRAVRMKRCPETVASEGFLRVLAGQAPVGIGLLREAFDGYRRRGHMHRATQVANSIGSAYIQLGEYTRGYYWARRSWSELSTRSMPEELLRLSTLNLLTYSQLLLGATDDGHKSLGSLCLLSAGHLPPTLEGIVTTVGDYALVRSDFETAFAHYKKAYDEYSTALPGYASLPYVRCLLRMGRIKEARAVVEVAEELVTSLQTRERVLLSLARLLVALETRQDITKSAYAILATSVAKEDAQISTEAVLALATYYLQHDRPVDAMNALRVNQAPLGELGDSGWKLFTPTSASYKALKRLVSGPSASNYTIRILGTRTIESDGQPSELPLRTAELAAILSFSPTGMRGQELLVELLGDSGKLGTLKARISRAKRFLPIHSLPYRLGDNCVVDATRLEELLQVGRLRDALDAYNGPLLPTSDSPGVQRIRLRLEESLRQAVLHSNDPEHIITLAQKIPDDLELWETAMGHLPQSDPRVPLVQAHVRAIRVDWGFE